MQRKFTVPIPSAGRSAPEVIFRRLSEAIGTGELLAGDRLPAENDLASSLGVAPMTLRRALSMLREIGLLRTVRGRYGGNFVVDDVAPVFAKVAQTIKLTRSEMRDLADWRRAISGEACFLAAERASKQQLKDISRASQTFDQAVAELSSMRMADAQLHCMIAQASESARLLQEEEQIQLELNKLVLARAYLKTSQPMLLRCHEKIVNALLRRDGTRARVEMISHAETTYNWSVGLSKR
jgi:GntR family transcriptional repressor for pyruvate dehydrogenase complex